MLTAACPTCGAPIRAGIQFCQLCGADVRQVQEAADTMDVVPPPAASPQNLMDLLAQATQGEYTIVGELGRGGMATVFLAEDLALERKVAIKVMARALFSDGDVAERFKREARTVGALSHPHVIPVYAVRETPHLLYFVMKYVEGRGLDQILKEFGPLPVRMVQAIISQVGSALQHAHRRQVIHRDVKPGNIMLDDDGWAVVTDFGIAKVARQAELTRTGSTVGTPYYMSPEQCSGAAVTPASDQYSLGIVAYEMLTGRVPFRGASIMDIMRGHFVESPPPIPELRKDCPAGLAQIVLRMLAKEPEERYPSIDDLITAIDLAPMGPDDPTRTQMVELARSGARSRPSLPTGKPPLPRPRTAAALQHARAPRSLRSIGRRRIWNRVLVGLGAGALIGVGWGLSILVVRPGRETAGTPLGAGVPPSLPAVQAPPGKPPQAAARDSVRETAAAPAANPATIPATPAGDTAAGARPAPTQKPTRTAAAPPRQAVTRAPAESTTGPDAADLIDRVRQRTAPAVTPPAPRQEPPPPQTASIRISTKSPNARLYINGQEYSLGSEPKTFTVRSGVIQLRIIAEGCEPEDLTDTIAPGTTKVIGRFNARCS